MAAVYTSIVTLLIILWTFYISSRAGAMRGKYGVAAPAITGHPEFEKANRVHQNTVEQMVLFLPALWLAVGVIGDLYAALIAVVWLVGRVLYAISYWQDPAKRGVGMLITLAALLAAVIADIWGIFQGLTA